MKLAHKVPCAECPWRLNSAQGFLGGWSPESYADAVANNEIPCCHMVDHGPESNKSAMCVGSLATSKNSCINPHKTPGAIDAQNKIGKRDDCFKWVKDFYEYHTHGKKYIPFIQRMMK